MLFETAAEMYMADRAKRLRATTLEGYESAIRKHIAPAWTGREVESITHEELQSWVDSIELPGAADKAFKTFRQIYRWAIRKHQLRIWDVTFCARVADSMFAENFTCWDTECYLMVSKLHV